ncbi:hypothetical protein A3B21_05065 [Candidatus Uhrbacteria bacterium RIFCSPLOWO2_01_FULL_47_24]|uniref:HEPN domain-containing protein n=1 Tax=Candidatus Uhrbacteria bacterium RIFCSPLOWO2_01_FULL_47_24 TaxID=1802401 RepID=A0A1F7UWP1_9BACT|nr:MAG: hypothetical protein A2753_03100 [Candidatus Uhrbacteria bacterium RIFCSPHIGHO2_01_FULL_47_11]OGL69322.1 MAG: hypothetical protein A3D58_03455 [Candidatus Uhrbacteria bacterium RIFCSPHIGHO2_02_FULL_46_47]OGL76392.1 MAG: hypothetical protein A3F52_00745 [Candidatus Uhrbacteria bacterium RIFCSPHIGHO2_12_FULL_47_11]OGL82057.1 MAG: hypothetical protein A3B21_05065 [Candidatus Uhrbacteria bacterium RIFCSPLOWO2_01_FULL_47_24]OGL85451.1 MAG: hypothetical protein A3J03_05230 [Candidatus Uhrbact
MPVTKYVARWLARAEEDLQVAELLIKENSSANTICLHSHQAVEKYLKGFLAHHEKHIRKIHELDLLVIECAKIDPSFEVLHGDAISLNAFYTPARYPADMPEFTMKDAKTAYAAARRIENFVLPKF